jgi:hypothetical protein
MMDSAPPQKTTPAHAPKPPTHQMNVALEAEDKRASKPAPTRHLTTSDFQAIVDRHERDGRPATQIHTSVPVGGIVGRYGNPQIYPAETNMVVFSDGEMIPVN